MADSPAKKAWQKNNTVLIAMRLNKNQDEEIIEFLHGKNVAGTMKLALREFMEKHTEK